MPDRRWVAVAALTVTAVLVLASCGGGAVQVTPPRADAATVEACAALQRRLPARLHNQPRRATSPKSPLTAAWGDPPIGLRCGVPRPVALRPTSQLFDINGVSWFAEPSDNPTRFTALARVAYVEVTIPPAYAPAGEVLIDLAAPIQATIRSKPDGQI